MPACIFRDCPNDMAPNSRVVCADHQAEVDAEEAALIDRTGHVCVVHPLRVATDPNRCPHCGGGSIARTCPWSVRVYRCQRSAAVCGRVFSGAS